MNELIDKVMSLFIEGDGDDEFTRGYNFAVEEYREKVKQILSTAEVTTVKHGQWKLENHGGFQILFCPECGGDINCNEFGEYYKRNFKFCPKCSTKMDGVQRMADLIERDAAIWITAETGALETQRRIKNLPAVNRWIPCSERLPENNQQCLIYRDIKVSNLKMTTGVYHSDRQVFIGLRHGTALKDAIAWMPLPEPPEGDNVA